MLCRAVSCWHALFFQCKHGISSRSNTIKPSQHGTKVTPIANEVSTTITTLITRVVYSARQKLFYMYLAKHMKVNRKRIPTHKTVITFIMQAHTHVPVNRTVPPITSTAKASSMPFMAKEYLHNWWRPRLIVGTNTKNECYYAHTWPKTQLHWNIC